MGTKGGFRQGPGDDFSGVPSFVGAAPCSKPDKTEPMTAHRKGACVIVVYTRDVAETKAKEATELGKQKGYPLAFTTEKEE